MIREIAAEFTTEELQEFLAEDVSPVNADPSFKAELRDELWKMVQRQYGAGKPRDPDDGTGADD